MRRLCGQFWAGVVFAGVAALPVVLNGAETIQFKGTVRLAESYRHRVADGLMVGPDPTAASDPCQGWQMWVGPSEKMKTYALIATTPRHHGLLETDICASDFRNSDDSGRSVPGPGNVNRPQEIRQFRFVATQKDYEVLRRAYEALDRNTMTGEQVSAEISQRGHVRTGRLKITGLSLGKRMDFTIELEIPSR
jgi:hypothetical protein